jgi:hypothetical protein
MKVLHIFFSFFIIINFLHGQSSKDASVMIQAQVDKSTPSITLTWQKTANVNGYLLFRKLPNQINWGVPLKSLTGQDTFYIDTKVSLGTLYEYRIDKTGANFSGYGYITAGIEIPVIENRDIILVAIDSTMKDNLKMELSRLFTDLSGDGYIVKPFYVSRSASVVAVKEKIKALYNEDTERTKSLFIIGHVPVPYSGIINPDGHGDHVGAWPTDLYYADVNGVWTDDAVESSSANPARIINKIGDGKFDQSLLNSNIELQTGRVDFYDMPAFSKSEIALMQAYLNKDHDYRNKIFSVGKRAVIDDNFGYFGGEAFAASGYNNFASLVGSDNVVADDYFTTLSKEGAGYLWSYGCGGGWYSGAGGVGSTDDFAKSDLNSVFTLLFGSYFGDWDVPNSFLRAPLAQGKTLTCSWSGRPHHQYHHMALGNSIGYSFTKTLNNNNYFPNIYGINGKWIHNSLMGDPTLRNDVLSPPQNIEASATKSGVKIDWTSSLENNVAYRLYYKKNQEQDFTLLADVDSITLSHTLECAKDTGMYVFMVRATKLVSTPSGSYYNISQGIFDTIHINQLDSVYAEFYVEYDDPHILKLTNESSNYTDLLWTCTNGYTSKEENPTIKFDSNGIFVVTLIVSNACFTDSLSFTINVFTSSTQEEEHVITLYPIPAQNFIEVGPSAKLEKAWIVDVKGRRTQATLTNNRIDVSQFPLGHYIVELLLEDNHLVRKSIEIIR